MSQLNNGVGWWLGNTKHEWWGRIIKSLHLFCLQMGFCAHQGPHWCNTTVVQFCCLHLQLAFSEFNYPCFCGDEAQKEEEEQQQQQKLFELQLITNFPKCMAPSPHGRFGWNLDPSPIPTSGLFWINDICVIQGIVQIGSPNKRKVGIWMVRF